MDRLGVSLDAPRLESGNELTMSVTHPGQARAWTCPECRETLCDNRELGRHLQRVHSRKVWNYRCAECGFTGDSARSVGTHLRACKGPAKEDPNRQVACKWCSRMFASVQGLQVHNARKHPAEYNEQLPSKRTTKWSDVEKGELARAEVQIRGGQARNINQMLHEKFPHRTVQAISTRRKAECHKSLVNELMLEEITMDQGRGVEARSRAPSPQEANADPEAEPNLRSEHPC